MCESGAVVKSPQGNESEGRGAPAEMGSRGTCCTWQLQAHGQAILPTAFQGAREGEHEHPC